MRHVSFRLEQCPEVCLPIDVIPVLDVHTWNSVDIMMTDDIEKLDNCEDVNLEKCIDWNWLNDLETHLSRHPRLLVSEIGLCKMA